jgi:hypothetical protein
MVIGTLKIIEKSRIALEASRLLRLAVAFSTSPRSSGATPLRWQQSASQQIEIGERKAVYRRALFFIKPR